MEILIDYRTLILYVVFIYIIILYHWASSLSNIVICSLRTFISIWPLASSNPVVDISWKGKIWYYCLIEMLLLCSVSLSFDILQLCYVSFTVLTLLTLLTPLYYDYICASSLLASTTHYQREKRTGVVSVFNPTQVPLPPPPPQFMREGCLENTSSVLSTKPPPFAHIELNQTRLVARAPVL